MRVLLRVAPLLIGIALDWDRAACADRFGDW